MVRGRVRIVIIYSTPTHGAECFSKKRISPGDLWLVQAKAGYCKLRRVGIFPLFTWPQGTKTPQTERTRPPDFCEYVVCYSDYDKVPSFSAYAGAIQYSLSMATATRDYIHISRVHNLLKQEKQKKTKNGRNLYDMCIIRTEIRTTSRYFNYY